MLEFSIFFVLFLVSFGLLALFFVRLLYQTFKRNWTLVKKNITLIFTLVFLIWITTTLLGFIHNYRLFGERFSTGLVIEQYHGPNDIHGDGLDYVLSKGDPEKYQLIVNKLRNTKSDIPSPSLNINNFHTVKSWSSCSTLLDINHNAFDFLKSGAGRIRVSDKNITKKLEYLVNSDGSICAYMFDGDDIDFWLLDPNSGTFFELSFYT